MTDRHVAAASVTLDVGPGTGALVIYPHERFRGREIEVSRVGSSHRTHTGVHDRLTHRGPRLTAIFGSLAAGRYEVWADEETVGTVVAVPDGAVAEVALA